MQQPINCCTYKRTQNGFAKQYWKRCYDCWPTRAGDEPEQGACIECIAVCHEGHTVDQKVRLGNFYCDCGSENKGCKLSQSGGPNIQPIFMNPVEPIPLPGQDRRTFFPHPNPCDPDTFLPPRRPNDPFPVQPMNIHPPIQMSPSHPSLVMGGRSTNDDFQDPPGSF